MTGYLLGALALAGGLLLPALATGLLAERTATEPSLLRGATIGLAGGLSVWTLAAIVLETDAPDIPPCWLGGGRNAPHELARIADTLAELRGMPSAELRAATTANALALLPLRVVAKDVRR